MYAGSLPPEWASMSLTVIDVSDNKLNGETLQTLWLDCAKRNKHTIKISPLKFKIEFVCDIITRPSFLCRLAAVLMEPLTPADSEFL